MGELELLNGYGYVLLELLEKSGWRADVRGAFAGDGVIVSVWAPVLPRYRPTFGERLEFSQTGPTVASVVTGLAEQCIEHRLYIEPAPIDLGVQLLLPLAL